MGADAHGNCRLTALNFDGSPYVNDVTAGDLWYFPTGVPHSLQGLGPDGCEFLLVFDEGEFSKKIRPCSRIGRSTRRRRCWRKTGALPTMRSIRSRAFRGRSLHLPGAGASAARAGQAGGRRDRAATTAFHFRMMLMQPQKSSKGGEVRIVDSTNFPAAANIAMAHVTLKPGGLRELHWHPNADEWQYSFKAQAG